MTAEGAVTASGRRRGPSGGAQAAACAALLPLDALLIAWLWLRWGITGWGDAYDPDNPAEAPRLARQAMWILLGGAGLTGGGLLALRWRAPGVLQLIVLGGAGALAAGFAGTG
ncbi:hypothetical protein ABZX40_26000 [Streptomyces sp. NPDC004610]|uniref:hypothetical protein n=1 Tax=unclassified Streptomyces TaxID=2593676 RepID=UPI0033A0EBEB